MAVSLNINTDNDQLNQSQNFNIEGIVYIIKARFNSSRKVGDSNRDGGWYISLYDVDSNPMLTGIRCMPNRDMFKLSLDPPLFTGTVYCVDTELDPANNFINLDNFGQGKRYQLWYFSKEELDSFVGV